MDTTIIIRVSKYDPDVCKSVITKEKHMTWEEVTENVVGTDRLLEIVKRDLEFELNVSLEKICSCMKARVK